MVMTQGQIDKARIASNKSRATIYQRQRQLLCAIKLERGCIDCGYKVSADALDFDHRDGEEHLFIGFSNNLTRRWEVIEAEIEKCDVRCRNCHAIRTAEELRRRVAAGEPVGRPKSTGPRVSKIKKSV